MDYLKGALGTTGAFFLAALVPTIWTLAREVSTEKGTGITAVAGGTLESIFSPWFVPLAVLFSVAFYAAGRIDKKELRILLFWIPTITASAMGFAFWALFAIILARFQKGRERPSEARLRNRHPQELLRIFKTNIPHHPPNQALIPRQLPTLHLRPQQIAQHPSKIFMPRKRHERPRVGHHADKPRQQPGIRQRLHLPLHRFLLVQKPPPAAQLNFPRRFPVAILKTSRRRRKNVIVRRI